MEEQLEVLRQELQDAGEKYESLKKKYKEELQKFQQICTHPSFRAEDNGDYHKPGYYYTCTKCGLFLTCKPSTGNITYR